jgi:hypothetical protein
MGQPRRRTIGQTRRGSKPVPGWMFLLFGLGLGVVIVLLTQLVLSRAGHGDGLAGLFKGSPNVTSVQAKPEQLTKTTPKPRFDFYTILLKDETVLPEQDTGKRKGTADVKQEDGVVYVLQAASFARFGDADQLKARLALNGLVAHIQKVSIEGKGDFHRVRLGPFDNLGQLDAANQKLKQLGIKGLSLKVTKATGT